MYNRLLNILGRLKASEGGNVLMLSAAALMPMLILMGGAVDMSMAYMARTKLQNACDSAVLAGRQSMSGTSFRTEDRAAAQKFFDFNFPVTALQARNLKFDLAQGSSDKQQLLGTASMDYPTSIMHIFGFDTIPISVHCDAKRDQVHNDIVLVLDVTGSMNYSASGGGGKKIDALRKGAAGLYRALGNDPKSQTRYAIIPYSHTVNVARSLRDTDILREQAYVDHACNIWSCSPTDKLVHINDSSWNSFGESTQGNIQNFRTSGDGCIEERPSSGQAVSSRAILGTISQEDIDALPQSANDISRQFGRYDPPMHTHTTSFLSSNLKYYMILSDYIPTACPSEATRLTEYSSESAFNSAIAAATARVVGGTYHDIGILWGARFMSRTGFYASDNPTEIAKMSVNQHIVFMTDGDLSTNSMVYSAHGIEKFQNRTGGNGSLDDRHITRFESACDMAKSMGMTIWVIALDVGSTGDIKPCATSDDHFYISDGSDLEEVFERIGRGIGNLRLTR